MSESVNIILEVTLIKLKEEHSILGEKGTIYCVTDSISDIDSGTSKYVINTMYYEDGQLEIDSSSFSVSEEKLEELFEIIKENLDWYENELRKQYLEQ
ncbi:hypothetical protein P4493_05680 [Bacillus thuringiensis]|nr:MULTISPECIES: hypothetical protein [Bacillus]EAO56499.1 hypothetical protein RBTH_07547 [Bacillus thuringiensis serovar israelensis ATCC 35646]MEC2534111.1 hypothetical protein [Bacillus cereus]MED1153968.1 hypothetical protein [Bacillus paranthracis]OUB09194.1 hypothetical protein BK708_32165 [Bacillus thuringiensis serovar yunnanensis]AFQ29840.1 hypothetical protein BTF1_28697 [Bacillus thuringiensis HD-789]